ncbi:MAG: TonB-dependent receptor [Mucilaginibacter sp.]|uniref:SusC/RagA family TonB-linked outer membrane protein n=1 Tax=Mucilaginibacter sp. TaxID=1882438 RepID=UPI0032676B6E
MKKKKLLKLSSVNCFFERLFSLPIFKLETADTNHYSIKQQKTKPWLITGILLLVFISSAYAQKIQVAGIVKDDKGEALIGVAVRVKGATGGTATDVEGRYKISVNNTKAILVFTYIGYTTVEELVAGQTTLNVTMTGQANNLNEIVVIGYGEVRRRDLTGTVGTVDIAGLSKAPVKSFDDALAGRVSGVQVTSPDGQPGNSPGIVIRGGNSVTQDNSPLYVVDGFPIENYTNNAIETSDIESIEVLKDASSTAIYGARGANGVIIITTKKGKSGAPVVTYSGYYGIQQNTGSVAVMDPYNYVKYQLEVDSLANSKLYDIYYPVANPTGTRSLESYKDAPGIDWQKQIFRKAAMQTHALSIRGGNKDTKYSISGSYLGQDGTIIASGYKRFQGRFVLDQNVTDKLKVSVNTNYSYLQTNGRQIGGDYSTSDATLVSAWRYRPLAGPNEDLNSLLTGAQDQDVVSSTNYQWNPVLTLQNELRNRFTKILTTNAAIDYSIIPELRLKITGGINSSNVEYDVFNNSQSRLGSPLSPLGNGGPNGSVLNTQVTDLVNENTLTYNKVFAKKHTVNVVAGFTISQNTTSTNGGGAILVPNESLGINGLSQGTAFSIASTKTAYTLASFLGRVNYNYSSRYLATLSFRSDGSSKFLGDNQQSYFPSGALAWHISEEQFAKKISFLSDAKLRGSYGVIGNNRVPPTAAYALLGQGGAGGAYTPGNTYISGAYPLNLANPNLKWENTTETDLGLDLAFFNSRIILTTDVYNKKTTDLLLNASLPGTTGYLTAYENIGATQNKGLEFLLSTVNVASKNFNWSSSFNISFNRTKVLELTSGQPYLLTIQKWANNNIAASPGFIAQIGQPVSMFYGLVSDGVYQNSDYTQPTPGTYVLNPGLPTYGTTALKTPGAWKFKDLNNDGVIDVNDLTVIGNPNPKFFGGFSNNFTYKGFDLNIFFQFVYGNQIMNINRILLEGGGGVSATVGANQFATYANRWEPDNPSNTYARANAGGSAPNFYASRDVEDGSFLRLKTVNLGYTFSNKLVKKVNVKSVRVYTSAQNLYVWTKYSGLDPEVNSYPGALTAGYDYSAYPRAKVITLGMNITF